MIRMLCAFALTSAVSAFAQSPQRTVLYTTSFHPKNGPFEVYTPVAHVAGHTFVVMPDESLLPRVIDIPDVVGEAQPIRNEPLDPNPDYKALADPHNGFSIGVDRDGYLHITGDMHQYGGADGRKYPERYQKKHMLYWRSNKPLDVAAGFAFLGDTEATSMPGTSFSYGRFVWSPSGDLYYSSRVRAFWASRYSRDTVSDSQGAMALGLYHYDPDTKRWSAIGGEADHTAPEGSRYFPVFFWTHAGRPDTEFSYQVYQSRFAFDRGGRMHFAVSSFADTKGNCRMMYAASDDGGKSWRKADGTMIPGLPLRGESGTANEADFLVENKQDVITHVFADRDGVPAVLEGVTADDWRWWNGKQWTTADKNALYGTSGSLSADGRILMWSNYNIARADAIGKPLTNYKGGLWCVCEPAVLATGDLYGLTYDNKTRKMSVVKISFDAAP
ncbi:MAG: hypothetical protein GC162_06410 [Planctomycetes bacterium]|nr:hypothetical protein [Planctomycetota bacterium]